MTRFGKTIGAALLGAALAGAAAVQAQEANPAAAVAKIKSYDFNGSEDDLVAVDKLVAAAIGDRAKLDALEDALAAVAADGAAPFAARQYACRKLWAIGSARCVPTLAPLLTDAKLGDIARYALGQNRAPAAGQALRAALAKADGLPRIGLIATLGERREAESVAALAPLLKGADAPAAAAAATALGRIGNAAALTALQGAPEKTRPAVAAALVECAHALAAAGQAAEAAKVYAAIHADAAFPVPARAAALGGLLVTRPDQAVPVVIGQLAGDDERMRRAAAKYVRDLRGEAATRALAERLATLQPQGQMLLIAALAERGDAAAVPALLKAAGHADAEVRLAALRALGTLPGDARSAEALLQQAAAGQGAERDAARRSLVGMRGEAVEEALIAAARRGEKAARLEAIAALGDRRSQKACAVVIATAADADADVRTASFDALRKVASAAEFPALVKLLTKAPGEREQEAAEKAVLAAAKQAADAAPCVDALVAAVGGAPAAGRGALLRVLANLGGPKALAAVRAALADGDTAVRAGAVRALGQWADAEAVDALVEVIKGARDATEKALAFRGLVRLMDLPGSRNAAQRLEVYKQVLGQAARPEDKKALLPGISKIASPEALALADGFRADEGLRAEAELAVAEIARAMASSYPSEARAAAQSLVEKGTLDAAKNKAKETLDQLERNDSFVVVWRVSEIYAQEGKDGAALFDVAFPPEKDPNAGKWRVVAVNDRDTILNFDSLNRDNCIVYLKAELTVPADTDARLEMGSDDGIKAWVNGQLVHQNNCVRPTTPGDDKVPVKLKAGANALLLKLVERGGNMSACCRVRAADGQRLPGLVIKPSTDEVQGGL